MFSSKTLFFLVFIALSVADASPLTRNRGKATLRFVTNLNERGTLNIAEKGRARAQAMQQVAKFGKRAGGVNIDITDTLVSYTAEVGVGSPATDYTLLIDTGSANTWLGADKSYNPTSTSQDTGNTVKVSYGSGSFSGEEYLDQVTLAPGLVIQQQSIGVASSSTGLGSGIDGILGVGPADLTHGTVQNTATVPTVTDNLYSQGAISYDELGIGFVPAAETNNGGTLTFGGFDDSAITGSVNYVPITSTSPASQYWGIDQSITYGDNTILSSTSGIVDTGSTLILIATDAFDTYKSLTGGTPNSATGLLEITSSQYDNLSTLTFHIGDESYVLSPNGQIWPRSLNTRIGGNSASIYLIVTDLGSKSGSGLDFINGYTFLERFYTVYDTANQRVGFATTPYTDSQSN